MAAACFERGLHVTLLGTGALYVADSRKRKFSESDPPNGGSPGVYTALRQKMEELATYFSNVLILRVLYPLSSDLDARGLLGKLAPRSQHRGVVRQPFQTYELLNAYLASFGPILALLLLWTWKRVLVEALVAFLKSAK